MLLLNIFLFVTSLLRKLQHPPREIIINQIRVPLTHRWKYEITNSLGSWLDLRVTIDSCMNNLFVHYRWLGVLWTRTHCNSDNCHSDYFWRVTVMSSDLKSGVHIIQYNCYGIISLKVGGGIYIVIFIGFGNHLTPDGPFGAIYGIGRNWH